VRALIVLLLATGSAAANPRTLPFTYTSDTLAPDRLELEQTADVDSLRAVSGTGTQRYLATQFETELVYGLDDRLELRLGVTLAPSYADEFVQTAQLPEGNGLVQRLRYGLTDVGEWPIDIGILAEAVENEREIRFGGKLILQRRIDRLRIAANFGSEYSFSFDKQRVYLLTPSAGATYELTHNVNIGVDSWIRGEYPQNPKPMTRTFSLGPELYVGPALMFQLGKLWWSTAVYFRATDRNHDVMPGEPFGDVWVRTMLGYEL
jgi:hypothetical protein